MFGDPAQWPVQDLIGYSDEVSAADLVCAYREGVFPMPLRDHGWDGEIGWFSPMKRAILPLDKVRVTRSLRKSAKKYWISVDQAWDQVLTACANPARPDGWIDRQIVERYTELFELGLAHSVETWFGETLVGGLYGVSFGGLFCGESMFHHPELGRDASKAALLRLVEILSIDGCPRLLDVQWSTPHLASLGVVEIEREDYLSRIPVALDLPGPNWG